MNDTPISPTHLTAHAFKQFSGSPAGLPPFKPPRTLLEAIDAAREAAQAEVLYHLPDNAPAAKIKAVLETGSAFTDAESMACLELAGFLPSDEQDKLAEQIADDAVNTRVVTLAASPRGQLETARATDLNSVAEAPLGEGTEDEDQPDEQFGAVLTAITDAFAGACETYEYLEMPVGVPFEAFLERTHDHCVRRGRHEAFDSLKPLLTWDTAAAMAEAIAEAAWQFRARELATPSTAFKVASKPKLSVVGN